MPQRWLFKSDPEEYSFADLESDGRTVWDGVSNNLALKNLRQVKLGDEILIYHSGGEKCLVGLAEALSDPFQDPSENDDKLVAVRIKAKRRFKKQLTLAEMKGLPGLSDFDLIRLPRLSVMPVTADQWKLIHDLVD